MTQQSPSKQSGAATLFTAVILLICITLITLLISKTILVETQITADNYRISQANAAASAAMDQAIAYYKADGLDHNNNGEPDFIAGAEPSTASCSLPASTEGQLSLSSGTQTTLAQFYFDNRDDNACDNPSVTVCDDKDSDGDGDCFGISTSPGGYGKNMTRALVTAKGWSDDCTAVRTITQCVSTFNLFDGGDGPNQPFISKAAVGAFGTATIINRYNNSTIWTGGSFGTPDAAFGTYLRPSDKEKSDYTDAELNSDTLTPLNSQKVSDRNSGAGIDIITDDATLYSKTADQFFDMFFSTTKSETKQAAADQDPSQLLSSSDSLNGRSGLIWVEGNSRIDTNDTIGDFANNKPAVVIINGDLDMRGGIVYGAVYVTGTITISGNPIVKGSMIGESTTPSIGSGNPTIIFVPIGGGDEDAPPFIPGTGSVVAGSWKDW